ncbi:MAG: antibiotic biosynthesis monooxygenase, partial [Pseudomonadota bacterium]
MYAVTVTFQIKPGQMAAFMPLMQANARTSLAAEPECHQFDIATDPARPDEVFLYELYTDAAAFD